MAPLSILEQQTPRHTSINRHQHHDECSSPSRGRTFSRRCNRGHEEPPRRESSFLSRASRKVLSVTGRQPRRHLSKVGPAAAAAAEEGEQRRSRKHSSLLELQRPQQASRQQTEGQHVHETWYYSANHVLVNRERMMRGIRPLMRSIALDELARTIATLSAQTEHCQPIPSCYHGNVLYGASIRSMHERTMTTNKRRNQRQHEHDQKQHRANVLNADFREFGMATHKGRDGQLYLCQLFDQTRIEI